MTIEQFLEIFDLHANKGIWELRNNCIRTTDDHCPNTFLAWHMGAGNHPRTAYTISIPALNLLEMDGIQIIKAADNINGHSVELRNRLLKSCHLQEKRLSKCF